MDVNWFTLPDNIKDDICGQLEKPTWHYLDRWMKKNYRASRFLNSNNEFYYKFENKETYTEFCLKWL